MAVRMRRFWRFLQKIARTKGFNQKGYYYCKITSTIPMIPTLLHLCSLKTELSSTIFSSSSISSLGRSAVMKALTVTDTSSGSWVSDSAVCTTWNEQILKPLNSHHWQSLQQQQWRTTNLINKLSPVRVVFLQHVCPKLWIFPSYQISSLTLE